MAWPLDSLKACSSLKGILTTNRPEKSMCVVFLKLATPKHLHDYLQCIAVNGKQHSWLLLLTLT